MIEEKETPTWNHRPYFRIKINTFFSVKELIINISVSTDYIEHVVHTTLCFLLPYFLFIPIFVWFLKMRSPFRSRSSHAGFNLQPYSADLGSYLQNWWKQLWDNEKSLASSFMVCFSNYKTKEIFLGLCLRKVHFGSFETVYWGKYFISWILLLNYYGLFVFPPLFLTVFESSLSRAKH